MSQRWSRSLQGRLMVFVLGLVTVLWLGAATLTWFSARKELGELLDSHLAQAAALLVAQQSQEIDDDVLNSVPTLHHYAPRVAFQVWHEGRLVLRSGSAPTAPMSDRNQGFETRRIGKEDWRIFASRGAERDVRVLVGERLDARNAILGAILRSVLAPLAVVLPLLALGCWWAIRAGLVPLRRLSALLAARAPQALEPVALAAPPREMTPLLDALNRLFLRMAQVLENERRFTADAAHELRTPIAAIRTQAQVARGARHGGERDHALDATLAGCDRASHLVDQLLQLSRLESNAGETAAPLELSALARRIVAELAPAALEKSQAVELLAPPSCVSAGNETLIGALIRNLVDNAIRYSPAGATIRVHIAQTGAGQGAPTLEVEDSGPGLDDTDMARLGQRFFRVLGNEASGSGLGWSIVRRIAEAHALGIDVRRSELGGLTVSVRWPTPPTTKATPSHNV